MAGEAPRHPPAGHRSERLGVRLHPRTV